jgi:hypothetical protein
VIPILFGPSFAPAADTQWFNKDIERQPMHLRGR